MNGIAVNWSWLESPQRTLFDSGVIMKTNSVCACMLVLLVGYPASAEDITLTGQPSWFSLGGEVYREREIAAAEKQVLDFKAEPRWFLGFPKPVTKAAFEAWKREQKTSLQADESQEASYQLPSSPPYPKRIEEVATLDQGAALKFAIEPSKEGHEFVFALTLDAKERAIRREVEHRATNIVPFLFACYADGKAIAMDLDGKSHEGGANQLVELVPAKSAKTWRLRVAAKSLAAIVPKEAQELALVAAFSERQHEGYQEGGHLRLEHWDLRDLPLQILVRSNVVKLNRAGNGWQARAGQ